MVLRIETRSGSVLYAEQEIMLYSKSGMVIKRPLTGAPYTHYGVIFGGTLYGIGSAQIGIIPIECIERLTVQPAKDSRLEVDARIDEAISTPRGKRKK